MFLCKETISTYWKPGYTEIYKEYKYIYMLDYTIVTQFAIGVRKEEEISA